MSELRLYLQRDSLHDGKACAWAVLGRDGRVERGGASLADAPTNLPCRLVLAAELVNAIETDLPRLPERKLAPLLASAVESRALEEAESLHAVLAGRTAEGRALCWVVSAPWLDRALSRLSGFGLYPAAALPEYMLLPLQPGEWSVAVNEEGALARFDALRGLALDDGDPPVGLQLAVARHGRPERIRLLRGNRLNAPDFAAWQSSLSIEVVDGGRWDWRAAPWPDAAPLLSGRFSSRKASLDLRAVLRPLLVGGLVLALIHVVGLSVEWLQLERERRALLAEQYDLARRVLPEGAAIVQPAWQVAQRLARLQAASGVGDRDSMPALMSLTGHAWPQLPGAGLKSVLYADGQLTLTLAERQPAWLDRFGASLATLGLGMAEEAGPDGGVTLRIRRSVQSREAAANGA